MGHKLRSTVRGAFWLLIFPGIPILMSMAMTTLSSSQVKEYTIPLAASDVDPVPSSPVSELPEGGIMTSFEYHSASSSG